MVSAPVRIAVGTPSPFREPADTESAYTQWGANCGPCAVAALAGLSLGELRPHLGDFAKRRYMNPTHIQETLGAIGVAYRVLRTDDRWPSTGLAFVQWDGPWLAPGRPIAEAYRHTHWVAVREGWLYEVNADEWMPRWYWEETIFPALKVQIKHCCGFHIRTGLEVDLCDRAAGALRG